MAAEDTVCRPLLSAHELMEDPYGGFGRVREEAPVVKGLWNGHPTWFITRYDDVTAVLMDRRFATSSTSLPGGTDEYAEVMAQMGIDRDLIPYLAGSLVYTDPPDHTRLRKLVLRAFSARRISALRPRVEALVDELLDALPGHAADGTVDLVEHFASPLPITVICEMVGVPVADREQWRAWSLDYTSMDARRLNTMLSEISAYIRGLVGQRRTAPADDLITGLMLARDEDNDRLTETELVTMVLTLVVAANETTPALIASGVWALLTHPGQLAMVREDPGLLPDAVQELLRWCGPAIVAKLRYATEDVVIGDTLIRQGDHVQVVPGAANHDPRRFPRPDELDITRDPEADRAPHLGYSRGAHYCLGAGLANQETEVAFARLFERFPDLALAVPEDRLKWKPMPATRQLASLPVVLGPAARLRKTSARAGERR
ncbi:cytochrome P450 [Streptomyces sparsogenes]|uniref:cytochrome P450 family protein n=1 Tax=Streptomyces sparsogenes TaxID=67365 RepID=UPI0033DAEBCA